MILKAGTYSFNDVLVRADIPSNTLYKGYVVTDETEILLCIMYCENYTAGNTIQNGLFFGGFINETWPPVSPLCYADADISGAIYDGWQDGLTAVLMSEYCGVIEEDTEVDDTFGSWFIANTNYNEVNASSLATIEYNGQVIASLNAGETATLSCEGKKMVSDVSVAIESGYVKPSGSLEITENGTVGVTEYEEVVVAVEPNLEVGSATPLTEALVVYPSEGYDGFSSFTVGADSPLPIEISSETAMTIMLQSAEVGAIYKYTGTTGTYENNVLYIVTETDGTKAFEKLSTGGDSSSECSGEHIIEVDELPTENIDESAVYKVVKAAPYENGVVKAGTYTFKDVPEYAPSFSVSISFKIDNITYPKMVNSWSIVTDETEPDEYLVLNYGGVTMAYISHEFPYYSIGWQQGETLKTFTVLEDTEVTEEYGQWLNNSVILTEEIYWKYINGVWVGYIVPEGSITITENSTVDVTDVSEVVVNVPETIPDGYMLLYDQEFVADDGITINTWSPVGLVESDGTEHYFNTIVTFYNYGYLFNTTCTKDGSTYKVVEFITTDDGITIKGYSNGSVYDVASLLPNVIFTLTESVIGAE